MPVCSYYCGACGMRLAPEDARYGRPRLQSLDWYCASCASELEIEPAEPSSGPAVPRRPSGRLSSSAAGVRALAPTAGAPASAARSGTCVALPCLLAGIAGIAGIIFYMGRGAASASDPISGPRPAAAASAAASARPLAPLSLPAPVVPAAVPAAAPARPLPATEMVAPPMPAPAAAALPAPPARDAALLRSDLEPPPPAAAPSPFVGNRSSRKLHKAGCRWGEAVKDENRVPLESLEQGRRQGFKPCRECLGS